MKHSIKMIVIIDAVILLIAGIFSLLITNVRYGTSLFWVGVAVMFVGAMAGTGSMNIARGEYNLKFDQKIPQLNYEVTQEKLNEREKSYSFALLMAISGTISICVGLSLNYIIK